MRKYITIVVGIIIIAASAFIARDLSNNKRKVRPKQDKVAPTVFVELVKNTSTPISVLESGRLAAKNKIEIFAEVQGVMKITDKEFKPGVHYNKGDVIVSVKSEDFYANLQAQKSNLQNLITSILPDLRLDYPDAYKKWDDYLRSFDLEKPIPDLPKVTTDKEKFFVTGRNIYTEYYNTKNLEITLSKYNLAAPYTGILTEALVTPGSLIRPGQKLGEFIDPSTYEMEVAVNKSILSSLKVGKEVVARDSENHLKQWKGKIVRINGKVESTTQTVKVFIELKGDELKEGMYLEAIMNGKPIDNSYKIARSLLVDESKVYIVADNKLKLVEIEPVFFNQKSAVIKGLEDGQKIISRSVSGAYSGMEVKIYNDQH